MNRGRGVGKLKVRDGIRDKRHLRSVRNLHISAVFHDFGYGCAGGDIDTTAGIDGGTVESASGTDKNGTVYPRSVDDPSPGNMNRAAGRYDRRTGISCRIDMQDAATQDGHAGRHDIFADACRTPAGNASVMRRSAAA